MFIGGSDGNVSVYNEGDWVRSLGREDPLEKEMAAAAAAKSLQLCPTL